MLVENDTAMDGAPAPAPRHPAQKIRDAAGRTDGSAPRYCSSPRHRREFNTGGRVQAVTPIPGRIHRRPGAGRALAAGDPAPTTMRLNAAWNCSDHDGWPAGCRAEAIERPGVTPDQAADMLACKTPHHESQTVAAQD